MKFTLNQWAHVFANQAIIELMESAVHAQIIPSTPQPIKFACQSVKQTKFIIV